MKDGDESSASPVRFPKSISSHVEYLTMTPSSLVHSLLLTSAFGTDIYDEEQALHSLYYAYSAYCDDLNLKQWDCQWCRGEFDIETSGAGVITRDDLQAFIGYDISENRIVLSFRGTNNIENAISDFEFLQIHYPHSNHESGGVHSGFYSAWKQLQADGLTTMIQAMFAGYPDADILITGHSLGGALAQIAALEMKQNPIYTALSIGNVSVITFGSPRWCDKTISILYGNVVDSNWRIVNQRDLVPTVPFQAMGYHHTATMIHYLDAKSREYVQCDGSGEDWTDRHCFYYITNIIDHTLYFNKLSVCSSLLAADEFEDKNSEISTVELNKLSAVSLWVIFGALSIGWILAFVFGVCLYRTRGLLKKESPSNSSSLIVYHALEK